MNDNILHQNIWESDDSIGWSLNALELILEYDYEDNDELLETKRKLQQAIIDHKNQIEDMKNLNFLKE